MAAPEKNDARAKALQDSYAKTTAWLIAEHKEEFDAHRAELLKDAGYDWSPPLTQEQKDLALLREIAGRNPELVGQLAQGGASKETLDRIDPHS